MATISTNKTELVYEKAVATIIGSTVPCSSKPSVMIFPPHAESGNLDMLEAQAGPIMQRASNADDHSK